MRNVLKPAILCAFAFAVNPLASRGATSQEFEKGRQAYDRKEYATAINHFRLADKSIDGDPKLHYYLANALTYAGKYEEAKQHYRKCLDLDPSSEAGGLARIALYGTGSPASSYPTGMGSPLYPLTGPGYSASNSGPYLGSPYQANVPSPVSSNQPNGQSVHQFVQDLNDQLSDRKRLAMNEAQQLSYARMMQPQADWYPYNNRAPRYRGWGDPYGYPMYGGIRNRHTIYYSNYSGFPVYGSGISRRYGDPTFTAFSGYGSRYSRNFGSYDQYKYTGEQRSLAYEQAATGLESQLLNSGNGQGFNPKGSNLYIRNYGSGIVPVWQPEPVVELLAKQEKLVIDEPANQHGVGKGTRHAAQESP